MSNRPCSAIPLVVVGARSTGKTSLIQTFFHGHERERNTQEHNGAFTYYAKTVVIDSKSYKLKIWDLSSDEKYKFVYPMYFKYATVAIVTYSAEEDQKSFEAAKKLIVQVKKYNIKVIALVAMKGDLGSVLSMAEVNEFSKKHDLLTLQASAKEGTNITTLFEQIVAACKNIEGKEQESFHISGVNTFSGSGIPHVHTIELCNQNVMDGQAKSLFVCDEEFHPTYPLKAQEEDDYDSDTDAAKDLKLKRPSWIHDNLVKCCHNCGSIFSVFVRKHHCRACGFIFCSECSSHFSTIPHIAYNKPVRVCNGCHKRLIH